MNHRCRLSGGGIKPPKGALVKSHGTERLGKGNPRDYQVWIWESKRLNTLKRFLSKNKFQERKSICYKFNSKKACSDHLEYGR